MFSRFYLLIIINMYKPSQWWHLFCLSGHSRSDSTCCAWRNFPLGHPRDPGDMKWDEIAAATRWVYRYIYYHICIYVYIYIYAHIYIYIYSYHLKWGFRGPVVTGCRARVVASPVANMGQATARGRIWLPGLPTTLTMILQTYWFWRMNRNHQQWV